MGPNPLIYPQNNMEPNGEIPGNSKEVQTETGNSSSIQFPCHGESSKNKSFESLLAAVTNETGDEIPQDLSCNKELSGRDFEMVDNKFSKSPVLLPRNYEQSTRPQIIVSSRKLNSSMENVCTFTIL